jgi:hypothetical protein
MGLEGQASWAEAGVTAHQVADTERRAPSTVHHERREAFNGSARIEKSPWFDRNPWMLLWINHYEIASFFTGLSSHREEEIAAALRASQ